MARPQAVRQLNWHDYQVLKRVASELPGLTQADRACMCESDVMDANSAINSALLAIQLVDECVRRGMYVNRRKREG